MRVRSLRHIAVGISVCAWVFGCGQDTSDVQAAPVEFGLPLGLLVECANVPSDLEAELWVSGVADPCALTVDVAGESTSGTCTIPAGRDRTVSVDWFVMRDGTRVLLAQARERLQLADAEADMEWRIGADDIEPRLCLDLRDDQLNGSETQLFDGEERLVCDLDASCTDGLEIACSNLGEVCAGEDPLQ